MIGWVLGGAAAAAYATACRLTGENLAAAAWDEWRLRRTELGQLAAFRAANPRRTDLVVSLTSIPSRLHLLEATLKSLLRQSTAPAEIRLCLPEWSVRENRAYVLPPWLETLPGIVRVRCADDGPATKFLSTLATLPADRAVLVVDDDRIYHRDFVAAMAAAAAVRPDCVVAAAGWSAPADLIDRPTTLAARWRGAPYVPVRGNQLRRPRSVDIVQGVHGYVVRPRFFDLRALADFAAHPAYPKTVDDVWLSAHCRVPRAVVPLALAFTDFKPWAHRREIDAGSLGRINRAADPAQRANSRALRHFAGRWGAAAATAEKPTNAG